MARTFFRYRYLLIALILLAAAGLFLFIISKNNQHPIQADDDQAGDAKKLVPLSYVGSQACVACHPAIHQQWLGSHHEMALKKPGAETVKGDFNDRKVSFHGVDYHFYRDGERFMLRTPGPDGEMQAYPIAYTIGIAPLQQYMIAFPKGAYQVLTINWDLQKKEWYAMHEEAVAADDWLHWQHGGFRWNTMCVDCHSTGVKKGLDPETLSYKTSYKEINVSCEACHGQGSRHLQWARANGRLQLEAAGFPVGFKGEAREKQVEHCARCHAHRTQSQDFNPRLTFWQQYMLSTLDPNLYHVDGQIKEEVYVTGSFMQSKMYHNKVVCTDCHQPHSLKLKKQGNALCAQCHLPQEFDTPKHHFHKADGPGAQCISCHMPGKTYMGNDFRRDHSFRVPRPDLSVSHKVPNACNQCHTDKSATWAADAFKKWYGTKRPMNVADTLISLNRRDQSFENIAAIIEDDAQPIIVRATALNYLEPYLSLDNYQRFAVFLQHEHPLMRYTTLPLFRNFPSNLRLGIYLPVLDDTNPQVAASAANQISDLENQIPAEFQQRYYQSLEVYRQQLAYNADFQTGQLNIGLLAYRRGDLQSARKAFQQAVDMDKRFLPSWHHLALVNHALGDQEKAIANFKEILRQDAGDARAHHSLGLIYAELNNHQKALSCFKSATAHSSNPRYYYNLGLCHQRLKQLDEAEKALLKAHELSPAHPDYLNALVYFYRELKKDAEKAAPYMKLLQQR